MIGLIGDGNSPLGFKSGPMKMADKNNPFGTPTNPDPMKPMPKPSNAPKAKPKGGKPQPTSDPMPGC